MQHATPTMDLDDAILMTHRAIPIPLGMKLEYGPLTAKYCEMVRFLHGAPLKDIVVLQRTWQLAREGLLSQGEPP